MTIYFAPITSVLPADVTLPVVDTGTLLFKLAAAEVTTDTIVLLDDSQATFVANAKKDLLADYDSTVLMNLEDVEYSAAWILAAQLLGRTDAQTVIEANRDARGVEQQKIVGIESLLKDQDDAIKENKQRLNTLEDDVLDEENAAALRHKLISGGQNDNHTFG